MNEIELFGVIGTDITAAGVKAMIADMDQDEPMVVRIDSPGGSVFAGTSMFKAFQAYAGPKKAIVESFAGSIASYLLMAFDEVEITDNGYVMIHNPSMSSDGDDDQLARDSKLLADIKGDMVREYSSRMASSESDILAMMKAETYFNASDAVSNGLATKVLKHHTESRLPESFQQSIPYAVVASLRSGQLPKKEKAEMANEPKAASIKDIEAKHPGMGDSFYLNQIKAEATMEQVDVAAFEAKDARIAELESQVAVNETEKAEAVAKAAADAKALADKESAEAVAKAKGNPAVKTGTSTGEPTAVARWNEAIDSGRKEGMSNFKAVQSANRRNPGLRKEMLAEVNA